jgi:hypothetical protein
VAKKATPDREAAIQMHNDKMHVRSPNFQNRVYVRSPNFQLGDYLLVAKQRKSGVSKLQVKWKSPRCVASVESYYTLVVANLLTKGLKTEHATRL